jgi:beta-glucosidase
MRRRGRASREWGALRSDVDLTKEQIEDRAHQLLDQMNLTEKTGQMSGDIPLLQGLTWLFMAYNDRPVPAGENQRLSIPGIRFSDGPRGVVMNQSTCFPVAMARGASWDTALEERIGEAIGVEARSQGANLVASVCINLLRHPAWGRAQETYGEDTHHLGEMGAAAVRGIQRHIMACAKHFAANSIENSRLWVDIRMDERTLREVYLPHFKRCVDEGLAAVMAAYNKVNGHYCAHNRHLLKDILKGEWGFEGFVMSDFVYGVHHATAANAGLDMEMPFDTHFGRRLRKLVREGTVSEKTVDEAVLRILRQKIRFAQVGQTGAYRRDRVLSREHKALAREAARKSIVLLRNQVLPGSTKRSLPFRFADIKTLAVIGRLATAPNIGDNGSSRVRPPYVVTALEGIREAAPQSMEILHCYGRSLDRAAATARRADAAVVIVGYTEKDEGERILRKGGDRKILTLRPNDEALILRVAAENPNTVVVLIGGSAIITEAWRERVAAILMAWYPGMEGGYALADILFGKVNPSAKLPCSFPASESLLPPFNNRAKSVKYGYFHGYRLTDKEGHTPAFPFGYGLSYTTFAFSDLRLDKEEVGAKGRLKVSVNVTNSGHVAGEEVVQLYIGCERSTVPRPVKELKGFSKVHLDPGETKRVEFSVKARQLAYYDEQAKHWKTEPGDYRMYVGSSSRTEDLLSARFRIHG